MSEEKRHELSLLAYQWISSAFALIGNIFKVIMEFILKLLIILTAVIILIPLGYLIFILAHGLETGQSIVFILGGNVI